MIILKKGSDVTAYYKKTVGTISTIGFVPTMGALHKGHISLLLKSRAESDITVCSIFINPTQFNNTDDFKKYPVTIEKDIYTLEKNGCDILFLPEVNEIYPSGTTSEKHFDLGYFENILEGEFRPGHFQGVCQVVSRLLKIVSPTHLFIGQKDYQQCMIIKRLLQLEASNAELVICPTLREDNGLAMSSRNMRLNDLEKEQAAEIYKTLLHVKQKIKAGPVEYLKKEAEEYLKSRNFKPDYVAISDAGDLKPVSEWDGKTKLVVLAAAYIDDVRLIDNLLITA